MKPFRRAKHVLDAYGLRIRIGKSSRRDVLTLNVRPTWRLRASLWAVHAAVWLLERAARTLPADLPHAGDITIRIGGEP